jgi:hypothetical protein
MEGLSSITTDQLSLIVLYVLGLLLIWGAMRVILRITKRVFQFGCFAILLLGAGLILLQMFGGS